MRTEKETQQKAKNKTKNNKEEGDELQTITRKKEGGSTVDIDEGEVKLQSNVVRIIARICRF